MALLDGLVAISVVAAFFYIIAMRMREKYPKIGEPLTNLFSGGLVKTETPAEQQETIQQRWTEKAATM